MNTSQTDPDAATTPLTPEDLALIEALEENRFNIRLLINKIDPIHPAQRDIVSLTRWARQPQINQAIDAIVDTHRELAQKRPMLAPTWSPKSPSPTPSPSPPP